MSNITRVTIVLSNSMVDCVRQALAAGAFTATHEAIHCAARRWSAAPQRHPPGVAAPSIAADQAIAPQAVHHTR
jgi:hypothetical protein